MEQRDLNLLVIKREEDMSTAFYPIAELRLFPKLNRDTYAKDYGAQAPKWDPSRPEKPWIDASAAAGVSDPNNTFVEYKYFNLSTRKFESLRLPAQEAATPNLVGPFDYPKYMIPPTSAVMVNPDGITEPLNPKFLCYKSEAKALAQELGVRVVADSGAFSDGPYTINWGSETRRMWLIKIGTDYHGAALLLQAKHKHGIGAPGEWKILDSGQPVWIKGSEPTGEDDGRPEVPIPCRELNDNEALHIDPFRVIVYRTDMESEFTSGDGVEGSVYALRPDLEALLRRVDQNVQMLLARSITED